MVKTSFKFNSKYGVCLVSSVILNLFFVLNTYVGGNWNLNLSWTSRAAAEAEAVAALFCSGHGRAYLDGLVDDGNGEPVCECNSCYSGSDCSHFTPDCIANANDGDPLFLEPFWSQHAANSAVVAAGWHRLSYSYPDDTNISKELERLIRKLHAVVGNAVTENRYIIFGAGSSQVLTAAVYALSPENSSLPAGVVASVPYYALYRKQVEHFNSQKFKFEGDAHQWMNKSDSSKYMIEYVTTPNNPDGRLNKPLLQGPNVNTIYDRAYYWPHFTPIPAPADEDLMVFTLSKLTGHAGSRFGWAVVKDETVFNRMTDHMGLNSMGVSRDTQLRAFKLLTTALKGDGRGLFHFGYHTMKTRWERLSSIISLSKRFSLQKINPQYCTFYNKVREFSPAYAWVKCEREEDTDCYKVLQEAKITGRAGNAFSAEDRYVRLSLIRSQDDFDLLIEHLNKLVSDEDGVKIM
ncbi:EGF-like, alliinase [Corchorus capsularis]|uniref:EGF-like, alliinase n=1 Tax=Corchorus capsularis TaxID=210143 RepID=A0A1R3HSV2_COCAP|nr:EGF-like, alliinase [Corchorus capsularis]